MVAENQGKLQLPESSSGNGPVWELQETIPNCIDSNRDILEDSRGLI